MAKTPIHAADAAAEALAINDLLQWIESARNYCAGISEMALQDSDFYKVVSDRLGYAFPRDWDPMHEGNGLDFLLMHQRDLLASIAKPSTEIEVQHG